MSASSRSRSTAHPSPQLGQVKVGLVRSRLTSSSFSWSQWGQGIGRWAAGWISSMAGLLACECWRDRVFHRARGGTIRQTAEFEECVDGQLSLDAIAFPPRGMMVLDGVPATAPSEFWMQVLEDGGWLRFSRVSTGCYQATALRLPSDPAPAPQAVARGVWWRRQAAIEAQRAIDAYLQGLPRSPESSSRSAP